MTESGKKWAVQNSAMSRIDLRRKSPGYFWIRVFCEEVEKRAESFSKRGAGHIERGLAFDELKRELLGK